MLCYLQCYLNGAFSSILMVNKTKCSAAKFNVTIRRGDFRDQHKYRNGATFPHLCGEVKNGILVSIMIPDFLFCKTNAWDGKDPHL